MFRERDLSGEDRTGTGGDCLPELSSRRFHLSTRSEGGLLYTSDAADEEASVARGGRPNNHNKTHVTTDTSKTNINLTYTTLH